MPKRIVLYQRLGAAQGVKSGGDRRFFPAGQAKLSYSMPMSEAVCICSADPLTRRVIAEAASAYGLTVSFVAPGDNVCALTLSGPVRLGALLQRLCGQARKAEQQEKILSLGRFIFDPEESVLITADGNDEVALTEKEVAILTCLAAAKGDLITRRALLTNVWGYVDGVETHTLETHIYRLRQKLEIDPAKPEILLTEEQGYSLKF